MRSKFDPHVNLLRSIKNKGIILSFYQNIYVSLFFLGVKASVLWKRERETETDCHIDPQLFLQLTIPRCVIFKFRLYVFSSFTIRTQLVLGSGGRLASCGHGSLSTDSTDRCKIGRISCGRLHKLFHKAHHFHSTTWLFPFVYTVASCAEKSPIDGSIKGQFATHLLNWTYFALCSTQSKNCVLLLRKGARGDTVIILVNEFNKSSSNSGQCGLRFTSCQYSWEKHESISSSPYYV